MIAYAAEFVLTAAGSAVAIASLGVAAAMWSVSDEPYEKVAPFKRRDAKTLLSMEDVNAINRAARTFEDLKAGRQ